MDGAVDVSGRSDGVVDARLRGNAGAVRSVYAGRWSKDSPGSHRVGLSSPPAVVGPVAEGGLSAHLARPDELVADPKAYLWSQPLSLVSEPSPETDFGVLVRAGAAFAVLNSSERTSATFVLGPTPSSWKRIGLVGGVGASWPTATPPPQEWFPSSPVFEAEELYHAAGGFFLSPALRHGSIAAVAVVNVSAARTLRPGTAASVHLFGNGDAVTARLAAARLGRHYRAPDGSQPARNGPPTGPREPTGPGGVAAPKAGARYRAEGRVKLERTARLLADGAVTLQEVAEGLRWIDRSVEIEWRGPSGKGQAPGNRAATPGVFEMGLQVKETSDGEGELTPSVELSGKTAAGRLEPAIHPVQSSGDRTPLERRLSAANFLFRGEVVVHPAADAAQGTLAIPIATEIGFDAPLPASGRRNGRGTGHDHESNRRNSLTTLSISLGGEWEGRASKLKGTIHVESRGRPSQPDPGKFWESYRLSLEIALRWAGAG
ncbi:MAG: hypothetical protein GVY29_10660 [Spirochaetes bacterium]|nr:hypothetical protein [Spirochaetota bacterium]